MGSKPDRGDAVTAELAAERELLRARRADLSAAGLERTTTASPESQRAGLRAGRAGLDLAAVERLRRPS